MSTDPQSGAVLTIEPLADAPHSREQGCDLHLQFEWWGDEYTDPTSLPCTITQNASWLIAEHSIADDSDVSSSDPVQRLLAWTQYKEDADRRALAAWQQQHHASKPTNGRLDAANGRAPWRSDESDAETRAWKLLTTLKNKTTERQIAGPLLFKKPAEYVSWLSPGIDWRLAERAGIHFVPSSTYTSPTKEERDTYFTNRVIEQWSVASVLRPLIQVLSEADQAELAQIALLNNRISWTHLQYGEPICQPIIKADRGISKRLDRKLWDVSDEELNKRFASENFLQWYIRFDQLPLRTLHDGVVYTYDLTLRPWVRAHKDHPWHVAVREGSDPNYGSGHMSDGVVRGSGKFIDKSTTCEITFTQFDPAHWNRLRIIPGQVHEDMLRFAESFQDLDMFITSTPAENRERIQRDRAEFSRLWNKHLATYYPPSFHSQNVQWELERIFREADAIEHRLAAKIQVAAWDEAHKRAKQSPAFKEWDKQMDEFFRPKNQGRYRKNKVLPATPVDCLWLLQMMMCANIFIPAPSHIAQELAKISREPTTPLEKEPLFVKILWAAWKSRQIDELIAAAHGNRKPRLIPKSKWLREEAEDEEKQTESEIENETADLRFGGDEFRPSIPATASDEVFRNEDDRAPNLADQQGDYVEHFGWRENDDPVDLAALKAQLIAKDGDQELTRQDAITYVEKILNIPGAQSAAYQGVKFATARQRKSRRTRMLHKEVTEVPTTSVNGNFQKYFEVIPEDLMAALQQDGGYVAFIQFPHRPLRAYRLNVDGVAKDPALAGSGFSPVDVAFFAVCLPLEGNSLRKVPARLKPKKLRSLEDIFDKAKVLHFQCDKP